MVAVGWLKHFKTASVSRSAHAGVVETAIANPNTSLAVLGSLSLVVLPGKHQNTAQSTPQDADGPLPQ